jgi:hypothetical protein
MSIQCCHYPETLPTYEDYTVSFDPTDYPEPDEAEQLEGCSLRDLSVAVRDLTGMGYSLQTIQSLVMIAAGVPPVAPLNGKLVLPPPTF